MNFFSLKVNLENFPMEILSYYGIGAFLSIIFEHEYQIEIAGKYNS